MKFPKEIIIRFEADAKETTVTAMDGGELVRCKDCIHYLIGTPTYKPYCRIHNKTGVQDYEFCSWAERKQTNENTEED